MATADQVGNVTPGLRCYHGDKNMDRLERCIETRNSELRSWGSEGNGGVWCWARFLAKVWLVGPFMECRSSVDWPCFVSTRNSEHSYTKCFFSLIICWYKFSDVKPPEGKMWMFYSSWFRLTFCQRVILIYLATRRWFPFVLNWTSFIPTLPTLLHYFSLPRDTI